MAGSPETSLITLGHAKANLRISHSEEDNDISLKMVQATATVLRWIKDTGGSPGNWTVDTVPDDIQAAIMRMTMHLMRWRGDAEMSAAQQERMAKGYLPADVQMFLYSYRDPTLA